MELSKLDLTTFSMKPLVTHYDQASLNALPEFEPAHVWLPCLQNTQKEEPKIDANLMNSTEILFEDNNILFNSQHSASKTDRNMENFFDIINTNYVDACHSVIEDKFQQHIIEMEQLDTEAMHHCSILPEISDPVVAGITMEVVHSDKQSPLKKEMGRNQSKRNLESTSRSQETAITKSPKTPRKTSDNRRRRDKANEREKNRIVVLKNAMTVLKNAIPAAREKTKITKLEVLKLARDYINSLREQLMNEDQDCEVLPAGQNHDFDRLNKTSFLTN
ncbi:uncharacterized protein LOC114517422 [Dendronephthya gigantea]|uniref:uncharacterized protein LOC114517422 n=1 Tax=Dendronephthya gigantea TaxID=151771 RepID=UPI00106CB4A1|nr:uncharacterized protein LOC114517422 [Dendronephthya gigantea]